MSGEQFAAWLRRRGDTREQIALEKQADSVIARALFHHDLALLAVIQAQEWVPERVKTLGNPNGNQHDWLATFALIFQSLELPRALILGASYTLSAAALKQEWDGICMLQSLQDGRPRFEKSPNIKNVLGDVPNAEHKLLQPIAHLTGAGLGRTWAVVSHADKDFYLPSPRSQKQVARRFLDARSYLLGHLYLQLAEFLQPIETYDAGEKLHQVMTYLLPEADEQLDADQNT